MRRSQRSGGQGSAETSEQKTYDIWSLTWDRVTWVSMHIDVEKSQRTKSTIFENLFASSINVIVVSSSAPLLNTKIVLTFRTYFPFIDGTFSPFFLGFFIHLEVFILTPVETGPEHPEKDTASVVRGKSWEKLVTMLGMVRGLPFICRWANRRSQTVGALVAMR